MKVKKYKCEHKDCELIAYHIRKCNKCGIVIITNRGINIDYPVRCY